MSRKSPELTDKQRMALHNYFSVIRSLTKDYEIAMWQTVDPQERRTATTAFMGRLAGLQGTYRKALGMDDPAP